MCPSQIVRWGQGEIMETPVGSGPQNEVNLGGPDVNGGIQVGEVNGTNELCDPDTDTVYIASQYGSDITRGPRPGTYRYTLHKTDGAPPLPAARQINAHLPPPLTITARSSSSPTAIPPATNTTSRLARTTLSDRSPGFATPRPR